MSSRPFNDRYQPRERDRTPPRFGDRRPSGAYNSGFSNRGHDYGRPPYGDGRDVPRGPRGSADTPTRTAPTGPRGGGRGTLGSRNDYRDAPNDRLNDRWRDGDDRGWERRTSPRPRTPTRGGRTPPRRDSREFPKPIDTDRARRDSRDGPPSAGSNLSDPPRNTGTSYRGGLRGRGDFRGRAYQPDDRNAFRQRSRSRGPRRERDRSVDLRDLDFRERARDIDSRFYRDREDRDGNFNRRDMSLKENSRPANTSASSAQSTPQTERLYPLQDRSVTDPRRENDLSRRGSTLSDNLSSKEGRRDAERYDLITGRLESARPTRVASPPPSAPQVPAFGSFRPSGHSSLSWTNPNLQKAPSVHTTANAFKGPPTAPRALAASSGIVPTAPKADRGFDRPRPAEETLKDAPQVLRRPTSPSSTSNRPGIESQQLHPAPSTSMRDAPTSSTLKTLAPPSAPRAMTSPSHSFNRAVSPIPPTSNPIWPRTTVVNTSPMMLPGNVPTGPKADRLSAQPLRPQIPSPRLSRAASQPFSGRPSTIPTKREFESQERDFALATDPQTMDTIVRVDNDDRPALISEKMEANVAIRAREDKNNAEIEHEPKRLRRNSMDVSYLTKKDHQTADQDEDVSMAESAPESRAKTLEPDRPTQQQIVVDLTDDEDEGDMRDILAEHEVNFVRTRTRLEAKKIDLSAGELRVAPILEELAHLRALQLIVCGLDFTHTETPEKGAVIKEDISATEPVSTELPTPQEDNLEDMDILDPYSSRESSLDRMSTPDPESLPYLEKGPPTPLSDPDPFSSSRYDTNMEEQIKASLKKEAEQDAAEQEELLKRYRELYHAWKANALELDRSKDDAENARKQSSPEIALPLIASDAPIPALLTPTEGSGRRMHRFASEYEIQRVMELSKREEEEKVQREKEAKEAQASASADREATIPDMLPQHEIERRKFEDVSQRRHPRDAIRLFEFVPPLDDFTEEEDQLLRNEYAGNIKVWGRIAKLLKSRTYKECINHYYATKWDKPYKTNKGRRGGGRVGRGGRKAGTGRGGRHGPPSALEAAGDIDMIDGNGTTTPLVTDSGRPRRAAAPVWPKDSETEQGPPMATPGRKVPGNKDGEQGAEKAGKRVKAGKEKGSRKPRNQPIAARPAISPQKIDKETKDKVLPMAANNWMARAESAGLESERTMQQVWGDNGLLGFHGENKADIPPAPTERPRSHSQTQRQGASSYWSVVEEHDFKKCLSYYGNDWQSIANHMGTKTQTMIKNHFQKFVNDGKHMDMIQACNEATRRRAAGEDMGPPPAPTQQAKRRYDTSQPPMQRTLAPNTDADLEQDTNLQPTHGSPPQFTAQNRFPPAPQTSRPTTSTGLAGSQLDMAGIGQSVPPRVSHPVGPRMGRFLDEPRISGPHQPAQQGHQMPQPLHEDHRIQRPTTERIKTEHEPAPSRPLFMQASSQPINSLGDREHARDLMIQQQQQQQQMRERTDHLARIQAREDIEAQQRQEESLYKRQQPLNPFQGTSAAPLQSRPGVFDPTRPEQRGSYGLPMVSSPTAPRNLVDLTESSPSQRPLRYESSHRSVRPPSPVSRPAQPPIPSQLPMQSRPPPTQEPPKRVNIMSMLNPEPEEERPRKRDTGHSTPVSSSTPSQQYRGPVTTVSEISTPRDSLSEAQRPYEPRPSFHQPQQAPPSGLPSGNGETAREPLPSISHRDLRESWPPRQPQFPQAQQNQQIHQIGSPHLQPQHPAQLPNTQASLFRNYRTEAFSSHNQPRANPSPPPGAAGGPYVPHSRTPSFSHPQHGHNPTPPSSMSGGPTTHSSSLRHNPYAHKDPQSGPSPPIPGAQPPRPEHGQPQSQYNTMAQMPNARFDRFREREATELSMREREPLPRFSQHTTPGGPQQMYPPPERSGHTPLNHLGYAPPEGQAPRPHDQRTLDYQQEAMRREQERARQRAERNAEEARRAQQYQEQRHQEQRQQEEELRRRHLAQEWRSVGDRYGPR